MPSKRSMGVRVSHGVQKITMLKKEEIEELGFTHLGSRWWRNSDDTFRIREWADNLTIFWDWKNEKVLEETYIATQEEMKTKLKTYKQY